ncbi:MAG: hypothetical protein H6573_05980 [Lewinellaceae bacterium]|nr:hypothetical protein [Phaeodactylibacter sp.]MCB0616259.1 hypothetical protein [Phaeodactylibacter sp.]MCB9347052.1 hypothetical protein [Lewinellaceae bacterium]
MQKTIFTLLSIVLIAVSSLTAQATKTYCNNRFGYCIKYPAELKLSSERPINGDGVVLEAANGIQASVSGSYNVMNWTPNKIHDFTKADFAAVIGAGAEDLETETTEQGFEALFSAGTYYQYAQMLSKGDVYLILTITGPEELLDEMKSLHGQLQLTFDNTTEGR